MTKIQWTEETWNPVVGCSIVSPGCTNCYAMRMAARLLDKPGSHYEGTTQVVNGKPVWTGKVARAPAHVFSAPLRRKKPTTYFVNSMGDLFHEDVPDELIDRVFAVIAVCPQHTFQVLTKRSARMREYFTQDSGFGRWGYIEHRAKQMLDVPPGKTLANYGGGNLPNVWLGVSAEDQRRAEERIPDLLATPAAVRFVSCEPLLGQINLHWIAKRGTNGLNALTGETEERDTGRVVDGVRLDWVIAGGESGPGARAMDLRWVRDIVEQCRGASVRGDGGAAARDNKTVPVFVKQLGKDPRLNGAQFPAERRMGGWCLKGDDMEQWPVDLRVRQMPGVRGQVADVG